MEALHAGVKSVELRLKIELRQDTRSLFFFRGIVQYRRSQDSRFFEFVESNQPVDEIRSMLNEFPVCTFRHISYDVHPTRPCPASVSLKRIT